LTVIRKSVNLRYLFIFHSTEQDSENQVRDFPFEWIIARNWRVIESEKKQTFSEKMWQKRVTLYLDLNSTPPTMHLWYK
jgi:hypothetical protein